MCASSELLFGGLREGGGTREAGSTVAESLVVRYQVGTHQIAVCVCRVTLPGQCDHVYHALLVPTFEEKSGRSI